MNYLLLSVIIIASLPSCNWLSVQSKIVHGSGQLAKDIRPIKQIKRLSIGGFGNVYLKQGFQESLIIEGDDNLLEHVKTSVKDDTLSISIDESIHVQTKNPINYFIVVNHLNSLDLKGNITFEARALSVPRFDIEISGASRAKARIKVEELGIKGSGSSRIYLEGIAIKQDVTIDGSMHYDAGGLKSHKAKLFVSGASRATVCVKEELEVDASGVAVVSYKGNPRVDINAQGASSVKKVG